MEEYENDYEPSVLEHIGRVQQQCATFVFGNSFGAMPDWSKWSGKSDIC
jgi:hypothetical protein